MKCDFCDNNEAVVFVQQVIGNSSVDLHLCTECARSKGIQAGGGKIEFSVAGLLNGLFDQKAVRNPECPPCPGCGTTLEELQKTGRLGCARCAQAFQREILILMRKHVQSPQHRGKYPRRLLADSNLLEDRERLRVLLKKAVADEDYEAAAALRDRLKTVEGIQGGGS
jgi:protein arginine kinase activator